MRDRGSQRRRQSVQRSKSFVHSYLKVGGAPEIPSPLGNKPITPDDVHGVDGCLGEGHICASVAISGGYNKYGSQMKHCLNHPNRAIVRYKARGSKAILSIL